MAIPTDSDGHIPCWAHYIPCLRRQIDWLAHIISSKTRPCHNIKTNVYLLTTISNVWHSRWNQYRRWPTIHLYCIPRIPSHMGRKAQTILGRISPVQWPCRASSKNCKEDSQWKHRRPRFHGQWQCHSSHSAVQKYPNSRYRPITGTTTTSPPAPGFHPFATIPLQTTSFLQRHVGSLGRKHNFLTANT